MFCCSGNFEIGSSQKGILNDMRQILDTFISSIRSIVEFYSPYMNGEQFSASSEVIESTIEINRLWRYVDEGGHFSGDFDEESLDGIRECFEKIKSSFKLIASIRFDEEFDPCVRP